MKTRTMFMHTLDGRPAEYDGSQVVFARSGRYARRGARLVASIAEIREQQRASIRWREARGWIDADDYGYVRVEVPA